MRLSKFLMPAVQSDQVSTGSLAQNLLVQAGMIRQQAAGLYHWLPAGNKVLRKVEDIIRNRMEEAGAQELRMPILQPYALWEESGRAEAYGEELLRVKDRKGNTLVFSPTNEEAVTDIVRHSVTSYRQLPMTLYQVQWKFRDELRPRGGLVRAREFLMKDAYSFDLSTEGSIVSYQRMFAAYANIFSDLELNAVPVRADTGEIGGKLSHEFIIPNEAGESTYRINSHAMEGIGTTGRHLDDDSVRAFFNEHANRYGIDDSLHATLPGDEQAQFDTSIRALELGHIFNLGTRYSAAMKAGVLDAAGVRQDMHMGCYGIGVSRIVSALAEVNHDKDGFVWPRRVAPFDASIVNLATDNADATAYAEHIYAYLRNTGVDVLYDDRGISAGKKMKDADLMGAPKQLIIGKRNFEQGLVEIKDRRSGARTTLPKDSSLKMVLKLG